MYVIIYFIFIFLQFLYKERAIDEPATGKAVFTTKKKGVFLVCTFPFLSLSPSPPICSYVATESRLAIFGGDALRRSSLTAARAFAAAD